MPNHDRLNMKSVIHERQRASNARTASHVGGVGGSKTREALRVVIFCHHGSLMALEHRPASNHRFLQRMRVFIGNTNGICGLGKICFAAGERCFLPMMIRTMTVRI